MNNVPTVYNYGTMRSGLQVPVNGYLYAVNDFTGQYYDIVVYDRPLTKQETDEYALDYLGEENDADGI